MAYTWHTVYTAIRLYIGFGCIYVWRTSLVSRITRIFVILSNPSPDCILASGIFDQQRSMLLLRIALFVRFAIPISLDPRDWTKYHVSGSHHGSHHGSWDFPSMRMRYIESVPFDPSHDVGNPCAWHQEEARREAVQFFSQLRVAAQLW